MIKTLERATAHLYCAGCSALPATDEHFAVKTGYVKLKGYVKKILLNYQWSLGGAGVCVFVMPPLKMDLKLLSIYLLGLHILWIFTASAHRRMTWFLN